MRIQRIDPPSCACTDCLTGHSVPLDRASINELDDMINNGMPVDATGVDEYTFDYYLKCAVEIWNNQIRG